MKMQRKTLGLLIFPLLLVACSKEDSPLAELTPNEAYQQGMDYLSQDVEKAAELLERAAEPEKFQKRGFLAQLVGDDTPPEQGNRDAQRMLAQLYSYGQGVEQDREHGNDLYLKAAMQGDGAAQASLGIAYERGIGVETHLPTAYAWFKISVEMNRNIDGRLGLERITPTMTNVERQQGDDLYRALAAQVQ
jgi:TPR repeat protein